MYYKVVEHLTTATDEAIVQAVVAGDYDAFGLIIDRYEARLKRYASRFLSSPDDRDDQVQDVFIKAFMNIKSFDIQKRFSPWIYRIAHNTFVNEIRRRSYNPLYYFDADTFFPQFIAPETADGATLARELGDNVESALVKMPEKYRAPLTLFFYESFTYQEIAEVLHIPISTVGVRINRGKQQLKKILENSQSYE